MSSATANRSSRVALKDRKWLALSLFKIPGVRCAGNAKLVVFRYMHTLYIQVERTGKKKCDRKLRRWSSESFFDIPCLIAVYNRHTITTDSSTLLSKIGERRSFCRREKKVMIRRGWIGERTTKWLRKGKRNFVIIGVFVYLIEHRV